MAVTIEIPFSKSFESHRSLEETATYLNRLDVAVAEHFPGLEQFEQVEESIYRWAFQKISYSGYDIVINFKTRFTSSGFESLEMEPVGHGNTSLKGKWSLKQDGKITHVSFNATFVVELPVPFFLKGMATTITQKEITRLFERYISNVGKALSK